MDVAAHTSLEPEAINHIPGLADWTGVVLCRIHGETATPRRMQADVTEAVGLAPSLRE